jgi:hypothetical protein
MMAVPPALPLLLCSPVIRVLWAATGGDHKHVIFFALACFWKHCCVWSVADVSDRHKMCKLADAKSWSMVSNLWKILVGLQMPKLINISSRGDSGPGFLASPKRNAHPNLGLQGCDSIKLRDAKVCTKMANGWTLVIKMVAPKAGGTMAAAHWRLGGESVSAIRTVFLLLHVAIL